MQLGIHVISCLHLLVSPLFQLISNARTEEDVSLNYMIEARWSCTYPDRDECWERRSWQRTWRSRRQGRMHTSPREPCQLFGAVEEKNIFFYHTTDGVCLRRSFKHSANFIIEIASMQRSHSAEVKNERQPSSAAPECFAPSSYPPEKFVCQKERHLNFNLIFLSVYTQKWMFHQRLMLRVQLKKANNRK